jgi:putative inorganic carbon (HCO3(-)) transporter
MNRSSIPAPDGFLTGALRFFVVAFVFCSTFTIAGTQTALGLSLLFWIAAVVWKQRFLPDRSSLYPPIMIFVAVSLVAVALSFNPREGLANLRNYLLMIIIPIIASVGRDRKFRNALFFTLLVSAAASGLYGVVIFLLGRGAGTLNRTPGPFSNAMTFGGVMLLLCSLFFSMAVSSGLNRKIRYSAYIAFPATLTALFFSFTRSSWLGMICAAPIILLLQRRKLLPFYLVFVLLFYLLMPAPYKGRIESIWDPGYRTNVQRMQMIEGGWRIFKDHWIIGVGPIDLASLYEEQKPEGTVYIYGHLHNNFVNVAVTLGTIGLLAFIYLWYSILRLMAGNIRSGIPPPERAWVAGSIGALVGFLVNGLFEWNFADAEVITLVYIIVGSNVAIRAGLERSGRAQEGPRGAV